jgi:hypothetical protein
VELKNSKRKIFRMLLLTALPFVQGCFYFPGVPSARTLPPGQHGALVTVVGDTTFDVKESLAGNSSDYSYNQFGWVQNFMFQSSTGSPRWNWGLGFDLWSDLNSIAELKYQWKSPRDARDWLSALDFQFAVSPIQGGSYEVNLAEVVTYPVINNWDVNAGFRLGNNWNSKASPASEPQNLPADQESWGPYYPWPGSYSYLDLFLGNSYISPKGYIELSLNIRFLLNQPYGVINGNITSIDTYSPIINFSITRGLGNFFNY